MSTSVSGAPEVKYTSSCVRPGVCEVRARALRPVSALIRLDLPTLERPAKAISISRIDGSEARDAEAVANRHSRANNLRPASSSSGVKMESIDQDDATHPPALLLANSALRLSNNSILAPCLRMITPCWSTDSVLFHAQ